MRYIFSIITSFLFNTIFSQPYFPISHGELSWKTFESKFATFVYHDPLGKKAIELAAIYDAIYQPVCEFYQYYPPKQTVILKDTDDYSNGAAYFFDNKIEIWATSLDFPLRGNHRWLEDVMIHEFTHIVQIQSAMKWNKKIPAIYFQLFGYEDVQRPDILYGYPNTLISYPILGMTVPAWLAEGTAQDNVPDIFYDYWDAHRDMILRARSLEDNLLTFSQMLSFNKTSLDGETVYNQGYSFTSFLRKKYGQDALLKLNSELKKVSVWSIQSAMENAFGSSAEKIYEDWKVELISGYQHMLSPIQPELNNGEKVWTSGFNNWVDGFYQDSLLVVRSNKSGDYFGHTHLLLVNKKGMEVKSFEKIRSNGKVQVVSLTNKSWFLYSQNSPKNRFLSSYSDLYLASIETDKIIRLTEGERLMSPILINDSTIFAIKNENGQKSLVKVIIPKNLTENEFKPLTSTQVFSKSHIDLYSLNYSKSTNQLVLDYSIYSGRKLAIFDLNDYSFTPIELGESDFRHPKWVNENVISFTSDKNGIFNLYEVNLSDFKVTQNTQVSTGVFDGLDDRHGNIYASYFSGTGYKIHTFPKDTFHLIPQSIYPFENHPSVVEHSKHNYSFELTTPSINRYRAQSNLPFTVYPVIRLDGYSKTAGSYSENIANGSWSGVGKNIKRDLKTGIYFFSTDPLEHISLSGSVLVNPGTPADQLLDYDRDIYTELTFIDPFLSKLIPIRWGVTYYNISRFTEDAFKIEKGNLGLDTASADVIYHLNQIDLHATTQIGSSQWLTAMASYSFYTSKVGSFYWKPINSIIRSDARDYFKGATYSINYQLDQLSPTRERSVNPIGRELSLTIGYENNELLRDLFLDESKGLLLPRYELFSGWKYSLGYKEHIKLPFQSHTLSAWVRRSATFTGGDESFFYFYAGGLTGMRGYPFYAIGGYELAHLQLAWRFPLISSIDQSLGFLYLDRLYGGIFADFGNAWNGKMPSLSTFKKDAGFELRLETSSFYLMPLRIFFSGTYGLDLVTVVLKEGFRTVDGQTTVNYGKEWQYHFGLLFNFELGLEK